MKVNTIIISSDKEKQKLINDYFENISVFNVYGQYDSTIEAYHSIIENNIEIIISDNTEIKEALAATDIQTIPLFLYVHFDGLESETQHIHSISVDTISAKVFLEIAHKMAFSDDKTNIESFPIEPNAFEDSFAAKDDFVFIRIRNKFIKVNYDDIFYIKAMENFVQLVTDKDTLTVLVSLKNISSQLPAHKFIRVHRSYIVNIDCIKSLEKSMIVLQKHQIPIGASYKNDLEAAVSIKRKVIKR